MAEIDLNKYGDIDAGAIITAATTAKGDSEKRKGELSDYTKTTDKLWTKAGAKDQINDGSSKIESQGHKNLEDVLQEVIDVATDVAAYQENAAIAQANKEVMEEYPKTANDGRHYKEDAKGNIEYCENYDELKKAYDDAIAELKRLDGEIKGLIN